MDITSIIGLILGLIAVGIGMILKGVSLTALINPAAILIIILGTIAAVLIAFPMSSIKKVPALFKILFTDQRDMDPLPTIDLFTRWAEITRREGILALEDEIKEINDNYLASGIQLAVDGHDPDYIEEVLVGKISAMEARHEEGAAIFSQAGTYAPTLGVLGAVVGLIAALADMSDTEALGSAISAAFIATLLGIFTGYVLWHPFANKLRQKSQKEVMYKEMVIEGIISIVNGESPKSIQEKLSAFLPTKEIDRLDQGAENA